jgi:hypothetical protein
MATQIREKMTNNPHFPAPNPDLDKMTEAHTAYLISLSKIKNGSKVDTIMKEKLRKALEVPLKRLAAYVQTTSGGDEAIIVSSGFDIKKTPSTINPLAKPTGVKVTMGVEKGNVVVSYDRINRARTYIVHYTTFPVAPNCMWMYETGTKRKILIKKLTSGSKMVFCIAAMCTDTLLNWSDEITTYIL